MRRWLKASVVGIVLLIALPTAALFSVTIYQQNRARALLRDVSSLRLGVATFSDAQFLGEKYGAKRWSTTRGNPKCSVQDCSLTFAFENKVLRKLHRERRVSFTVSLIVKDGHVVSKQIIYGLGTTSVAKFVYILSDHLELSSLGQDVTTPWTDSPDESSRMVKVELSPGSAADLRRRAYSLDLSCLAMVFGCNARPNFIPAGL